MFDQRRTWSSLIIHDWFLSLVHLLRQHFVSEIWVHVQLRFIARTHFYVRPGGKGPSIELLTALYEIGRGAVFIDPLSGCRAYHEAGVAGSCGAWGPIHIKNGSSTDSNDSSHSMDRFPIWALQTINIEGLKYRNFIRAQYDNIRLVWFSSQWSDDSQDGQSLVIGKMRTQRTYRLVQE